MVRERIDDRYNAVVESFTQAAAIHGVQAEDKKDAERHGELALIRLSGHRVRGGGRRSEVEDDP